MTHFWDDGDERLERRIGAIAADLIVAGEAGFRDHLVEQREWDEQRVRWAQERRLAELEKLRAQRRTDLRASGELLRQAGEIRALVAQVRAATAEQLARWERWALAEADRLDPVKSGQVGLSAVHDRRTGTRTDPRTLRRTHDVLPFLERQISAAEAIFRRLPDEMADILAGSPDFRPPERGSGAVWVQLEGEGGGAAELVIARPRADGELWVIAPAGNGG